MRRSKEAGRGLSRCLDLVIWPALFQPCFRCGKVNIATQIRSTFVKAVHAYMDAHPEDYSERVIKSGRAALREFMVEQLRAFGCAGMAREF